METLDLSYDNYCSFTVLLRLNLTTDKSMFFDSKSHTYKNQPLTTLISVHVFYSAEIVYVDFLQPLATAANL